MNDTITTPITPPLPGVHQDVPNEDYHKMDCCSRGMVWDAHCGVPLARIRYDFLHPKDQTHELMIGSAVHAAVLQPQLFEREYVALPDNMPDRRTKAGKEAWAAMEQQNKGKTLLDPEDMQRVFIMAETVKSHPGFKLLMQEQKPMVEGTVIWSDFSTGMMCRARPDVYLPDIQACLDLKTTADASDMESILLRYGYHFQAAFYQLGLEHCGLACSGFIFVFVEKSPPYCVRVAQIEDVAVTLARTEMVPVMKRLAQAFSSREWPSYSDGVESVSLPEWKLRRAERSES